MKYFNVLCITPAKKCVYFLIHKRKPIIKSTEQYSKRSPVFKSYVIVPPAQFYNKYLTNKYYLKSRAVKRGKSHRSGVKAIV
jgi:hypothetical protein